MNQTNEDPQVGWVVPTPLNTAVNQNADKSEVGGWFLPLGDNIAENVSLGLDLSTNSLVLLDSSTNHVFEFANQSVSDLISYTMSEQSSDSSDSQESEDEDPHKHDNDESTQKPHDRNWVDEVNIEPNPGPTSLFVIGMCLVTFLDIHLLLRSVVESYNYIIHPSHQMNDVILFFLLRIIYSLAFLVVQSRMVKNWLQLVGIEPNPGPPKDAIVSPLEERVTNTTRPEEVITGNIPLPQFTPFSPEAEQPRVASGSGVKDEDRPSPSWADVTEDESYKGKPSSFITYTPNKGKGKEKQANKKEFEGEKNHEKNKKLKKRGAQTFRKGAPRGKNATVEMANNLLDMMTQEKGKADGHKEHERDAALEQRGQGRERPRTQAEIYSGERIERQAHRDLLEFVESDTTLNGVYDRLSNPCEFVLHRPCPGSLGMFSKFAAGVHGIFVGSFVNYVLNRLARMSELSTPITSLTYNRPWWFRTKMVLKAFGYKLILRSSSSESVTLVEKPVYTKELFDVTYHKYRWFGNIAIKRDSWKQLYFPVINAIRKYGTLLSSIGIGAAVGYLTYKYMDVPLRQETVVTINESTQFIGPQDNRGVGVTTRFSEYINGVRCPTINPVIISDRIQYLGSGESSSLSWRNLSDAGFVRRYFFGMCSAYDRPLSYELTERRLEVNTVLVAELVYRLQSVKENVIDRCVERANRIPSVNRQAEMSSDTRAALVAGYIILSIQQTLKTTVSDPFCIEGCVGSFQNLTN